VIGVVGVLRPAIFGGNVPPFGKAGLTEPGSEHRHKLQRIVWGAPQTEQPDHRHGPLLPARRDMLRNTSFVNFYDLCAISLPLRGDGLPVGLMLVTRNGHDHRLFRVAAALERLLSR